MRRLTSPECRLLPSDLRTRDHPHRGRREDPIRRQASRPLVSLNDCRIVFMITTLRKKVGKVPNRARKGGKFGTSLWKNTLIFGRAPLLSTMTVNAYAYVDVNAYVNAIGQKPGPFLGHLSQSRSKFPRRRSTPTPIYVAEKPCRLPCCSERNDMSQSVLETGGI